MYALQYYTTQSTNDHQHHLWFFSSKILLPNINTIVEIKLKRKHNDFIHNIIKYEKNVVFYTPRFKVN